MSGAYAHTLGAAAGLAMVESAVVSDEEPTVQVDLAGRIVKATLSHSPALRSQRFADACLRPQ